MKLFAIYLFTLILSINTQSQNRWEKLGGPLGATITGLAAKGDTIIAGTGYLKGLIFYSFDGGKNWSESKIKLNNRIFDFLITDNFVLSVGPVYGIYRSTNFSDWENVYSGLHFNALAKDYNNIIYAATGGRIYESRDDGRTWDRIINSAGGSSSFVMGDDSTLYLGGSKKLFKKKHNVDWEIINLSDTIQATYLIALDQTGNIFARGSAYTLLSTNGGISWEAKSFMPGEYPYALRYNNRLIGGYGDETGWFGNNYGVAVSDDQGMTWHWSNTGLPPKFAVAHRLSNSGDNTYLGTNAAGVFKSTNFGESWFPVNNGITAALTYQLIIAKDGTYYTANYSNGIQKSTDKGETWEVINNGLTNSYCYSIAEDDNGILFTGTEKGIFRSANKGANWVLTASAGNSNSFRLVKDNRNRIYTVNFGSGLHRTTDLGVSWERLDQGFVSRTLYAFEIDKDETIYVGGRGGSNI
jgi:photosystem II stability/assembly factor-like uncharacterized protein